MDMGQYTPAASAHQARRGPWVLGVQYSLTTTAALCLSIRLYARGSSRAFGWDDFFLCLSWVIGLCELVIIQLNVNAGFGRQILEINPDGYQSIIKYSMLFEILMPFGIGFVKIAVITFVMKMVKKAPSKRWVQFLCYLDLLLFVPVTIAFFLVMCLQCVPLSSAWKEYLPSDKCRNRGTAATVMVIQSAFSALSDLITSIAPIFILKTLQIDRGLKIWSCALLGLGCIVTSLSIARAVVGYQSLEASILDQAWTGAAGAVWAVAEHQVGIMVACIPVFTPMLLRGLRLAKSTFSYIKVWMSSSSRLLPKADERKNIYDISSPPEEHHGKTASVRTNSQITFYCTTCTFEVTADRCPHATV